MFFSARVEARATFNPARIIDDAVFTDDGTLTISQIQQFLNSKVPKCDTNGTKMYNSTLTRAQYGRSKGAPPPYKCLKDYTEGGKKAAQIIYEAAQAYDINPQVLIVTLQKEQGLVTDDWPWPIQYRAAMGFACPDTAPCDPDFAGFTKQVQQAARHYRNYFDENPDWIIPYTRGSNFIYYHPDMDRCGGKTVNIQNRSTAALYNYTPYQPNKAALAANYGTGDSCSSYGNRNFFNYFNDWFGSSLEPEYRVSDYHRCCNFSAVPGSTQTVRLYYKNTSNVEWYDEIGSTSPGVPIGTRKVLLFTSRPIERSSYFTSTKPARNFTAVYQSDGQTLSTNGQHRVRPGQIARYDITLTLPMSVRPGTYTEFYQPVLFGKPNAFNDPGSYIRVTVKTPVYKSETYRRAYHEDALPGDEVTQEAWFKNVGNMPWYDAGGYRTIAPDGAEPVYLFAHYGNRVAHPFGENWGRDRNVPGYNFTKVYESNGTTESPNQDVVMPGQIAKYEFTSIVPVTTRAGRYRTFFQPDLRSGPFTMNDPSAFLDINVTANARLTGEIVGRLTNNPATPASEFDTAIRVKNTGNLPWYDDVGVGSAPGGRLQTMLATDNPLFRSSRFGRDWERYRNIPTLRFDSVAKSDGTPAANQHVVQPGETVKLNLHFVVFSTTPDGTYREYFQLLGRGKIDGRWVNLQYGGTETYLNVIVN